MGFRLPKLPLPVSPILFQNEDDNDKSLTIIKQIFHVFKFIIPRKNSFITIAKKCKDECRDNPYKWLSVQETQIHYVYQKTRQSLECVEGGTKAKKA